MSKLKIEHNEAKNEGEKWKFEPAYTSYSGDGETHPRAALSGDENIGRIRITDPNPNYGETAADLHIRSVNKDGGRKVSSALKTTNIPYIVDKNGTEIDVVKDAEKIAAYRLGQWAEENFTRLEINVQKYRPTITLKDGETIEIDNKHKEALGARYATDISDDPGQEYRHEAMKLERGHVSDIVERVTVNMQTGNAEKKEAKKAVQAAIEEKAQAKYDTLLEEAQREVESGAALLAPIYTMANAGLLTPEKTNEIVQHQFEVGRADANSIASIRTSISEPYQLEGRINLTPENIVSMQVSNESANVDISFDIQAAGDAKGNSITMPVTNIIVPTARVEAYDDAVKHMAADTRKERGKVPLPQANGRNKKQDLGNHRLTEHQDGTTTITIDGTPFDDVVSKLTDAKLLPQAIADKINEEFASARKQAQTEVLDQLEPATAVNGAEGMGKAKAPRKRAKS